MYNPTFTTVLLAVSLLLVVALLPTSRAQSQCQARYSNCGVACAVWKGNNLCQGAYGRAPAATCTRRSGTRCTLWTCTCNCAGSTTAVTACRFVQTWTATKRHAPTQDAINHTPLRREATGPPTDTTTSTYRSDVSFTEEHALALFAEETDVTILAMNPIGLIYEDVELSPSSLLFVRPENNPNNTIVYAPEVGDGISMLSMDIPEGQWLYAEYTVRFEALDTFSQSSYLVETHVGKMIAAPIEEGASARPGYVVRTATVKFNVLGILNNELMNTLTSDNGGIELGDETYYAFELSDGNSATKRSAPADSHFTLTFQSQLTEAQLNFASQSMAAGMSAIAPASSGGVAAGTIVGAVLGSVAGAVLITVAVGGAAVAGRTWMIRRKRNATADLDEDDSVSENVGPAALHEDNIELEQSFDKPKFSVQVMGNSEVAGSLTMRNPQLHD